MTVHSEEQLLDLLSKKATEGLSAEETRQLETLLGEFEDDNSFELAAAAISMIDLNTNEPLPGHLQAKILAEADKVLDAKAKPVRQIVYAEPKTSFWNMNWFGWLGWAGTAAACAALAIALLFPRERIMIPALPQAPTVAEMREKVMTAPDMIKASWSPGNVKDMSVSGDIVWSDNMQKGYMRLHGLPVNDTSKQTYQLWIFDETQDEKTPIDGGTFDIQDNGDIIIPINAKLRAVRPHMFAVTVEKPGGVVVSKRDKIPALAKVETL